jgi:hypothetical protein
MTKGQSRKNQIRRSSAAEPRKPVESTEHERIRPENGRQDLWSHRLRARIATANKAVLAAIGAGVLGAITAGVLALPHLVASIVHGSSPPLTVGGGPSPGNSAFGAAGAACVLGGEFILPGKAHLPQAMSASQANALTSNAADIDIDSTSGTYTLQASPGQTVVITAVHTVVIRRVPAPRATEVLVEPNCFSQGATIFNLRINLDGSNLSPTIKTADPSNPNKMITLNGLQTTVTNGSPIIINFFADTNKYDVIWELLIDYTVNGQSRDALIENGSQPFHTMAGRPDDWGLVVAPNQGRTVWSVTRSSPNQMNAG